MCKRGSHILRYTDNQRNVQYMYQSGINHKNTIFHLINSYSYFIDILYMVLCMFSVFYTIWLTGSNRTPSVVKHNIDAQTTLWISVTGIFFFVCVCVLSDWGIHTILLCDENPSTPLTGPCKLQGYSIKTLSAVHTPILVNINNSAMAQILTYERPG